MDNKAYYKLVSGYPEMYLDKAFLSWCAKQGIDREKLVYSYLEEQVEDLYSNFQDE